MQKVDLKKVLDMLVNEEQDSAEGLLHQWFVEKTKAIHERMIQEDDIFETDDLTKSIEDDQDAIEAEEYYGEDEDSPMGDEDDGAIDADAASDVEADDGSDDDMAGDTDVPADVTTMATDPKAIQDQFADLQSDLARLKAEFAKITGMDASDTSMDPTADSTATDPSAPSADASELDDPMESIFTEEDFADLEESFELEKVTGHDMTTPEYAGAGGKFTGTDTRSIALNKGPDIMKGKPVEIKSPEYKGGWNRQEAPPVKQGPLARNQVKKSTDDLEEVPPMGPKGALLNSTKDWGKVSPKDMNSLQTNFKESKKR
jgi:hypothetical protein